MGLAFPKRYTRDALGPKLRNQYPVENPETDVDAAALNALFWSATGAQLMVPRASLVAEWDGGSSAFTVFHQEEAWNPSRDQLHPELERDDPGTYHYTFAPTYLDEDGTEVSTVLIAADAKVVLQPGLPGAIYDALAYIDGTDPLVIRVSVFDRVTFDPADVRFWLEVM